MFAWERREFNSHTKKTKERIKRVILSEINAHKCLPISWYIIAICSGPPVLYSKFFIDSEILRFSYALPTITPFMLFSQSRLWILWVSGSCQSGLLKVWKEEEGQRAESQLKIKPIT